MSLDRLINVIPHSIKSAPEQMAIDNAILDYINSNPNEPPAIRTYSFNKPAVILGYAQKPRVNQDLINELGIDLTVRESGGGHLLFSPLDINISFIASKSQIKETGISLYHKINSLIVNALRISGYDAHLGRTSIRLDSPAGKIIAGSAQKHKTNAFIQQTTILVSPYTTETFKILEAREDEIKAWKNKVTTLPDSTKLNSTKIPHNLIASLEDIKLRHLNDTELAQAKEYHNNKYSNYQYILSGKKEYDICLVAEYTKDRQMEAIVNV